MEMFTRPHKVPPDLKRDTVLRVDLGLGLGLGLVLSASSTGVVPTELGCVSL
jgi:hypothetical protein